MLDGWKAKAIYGADEDWITTDLLTPSLIATLGSDDSHGRKWLESIRRFDTLSVRYAEKHANELEAADNAFDGAQTIVGLILIYNSMHVKCLKCKGKEAPQHITNSSKFCL